MIKHPAPRRSPSPVDSARSSRSVAQTYLRTSKDAPPTSSFSRSTTTRPGSGRMDFWMPKGADVQQPSISIRHNPAKLMMPWTLPVQPISEVDLDMYHSQFDLDGQPPSLIRENLVCALRQFTDGVNGSKLHVEKTYNLKAVPKFVFTEFTNIDGINPTHIFAIYNHVGKLTFYPIHSLVLGSNCAALNQFPPSPITHGMTPRTKDSAELSVTLLPLPFPDAFPTFYAYIYRKSLVELREELVTKQLPTTLANPQLLPPSLAVVPGSEASADTQPTIKDRRTRIAFNIYGVWAIARTLKLVDAEFYRVVQECYDEVVAPLKIAAGYRRPSFVQEWLPPTSLPACLDDIPVPTTSTSR